MKYPSNPKELPCLSVYEKSDLAVSQDAKSCLQLMGGMQFVTLPETSSSHPSFVKSCLVSPACEAPPMHHAREFGLRFRRSSGRQRRHRGTVERESVRPGRSQLNLAGGI